MSQSTSFGEGLHSPLREVAEQVRHLWWIPLLTGLVSIGFGLAILAADWTLHALVIITGLVFVIRGIALAFSPAYAGRRMSGEQVVAGIAGVIAGVVLVAWPGPSLLVLPFSSARGLLFPAVSTSSPPSPAALSHHTGNSPSRLGRDPNCCSGSGRCEGPRRPWRC